MRVLITGAGGQLGQALQSTAPSWANTTALGSSELDIVDRGQVERAIDKFQPEWIVNAAAYTAVDQAEHEPQRAKAVNQTAVGYLAEDATSIGARLLHISTDFVFDGKAQRPYRPNDITNPTSVYGQTKRGGERAALSASQGAGVVLRTAWLYSSTGRNFLTTMQRLMVERSELKVVDDQRGAPTAAPDLARAIWSLMRNNVEGGTYHFTNGGDASWYEFAQTIRSLLKKAYPQTALAHIAPTDTAGFPTPAERPAYSVLDCSNTEAVIGCSRNWQEALESTISALGSRC